MNILLEGPVHIFDGKCPHCFSDKGFQTFGTSNMQIFDYKTSNFFPAELDKLRRDYANNPLAWYCLAGRCLSCKKPVVAHVLAGTAERQKIHKYYEGDTDCDVRLERIEIFPKPKVSTCPAAVPNQIAKQFISAQEMLNNIIIMHGNILVSCRAVVEAAVNDIGGFGSKENLKQKIEDIYKRGLITESLKKWADVIKDFGNEGAHSTRGSRADAEEMVEFTRIFLEYVYELPQRVKDMRKQVENLKAGKNK